MKVISRNQALELMKSTNGKMFSVVFTKKDGSTRHMNCRTGVKKGVKGVGRNYDPADHALFPVYDMQAHGFRMISWSRLHSLQVAGEFYTVR